MYLTYDEYTAMGGTLDATTFARYEYETEYIINWYTFDRLIKEETIPDRVKLCVFRIVGLFDEQDKILNHNSEPGGTNAVTDVAQEQDNDGVGTKYVVLSSYNVLSYCKKEIETHIQQCLRGAVNSIGHLLLYRGLYPGE